MKEQLITFETAKLTKEKGFNWKSSGKYIDNKLLSPNGWITNWNKKEYTTISAPTQSLLQKWLRDVHNIHIKVDDFIDDETGIEWDYEIVIIGTDINEKGEYIPLISYSTNDALRQFLNYESALESGLKEALKLIK